MGAIFSSCFESIEEPKYSIADQEARFQNAKRTENVRYLDIDRVFDPSQLDGKRFLVVGASRGLGLELVRRLVASGAKVVATTRGMNDALRDMSCTVITGVEVTSDEGVERIAASIDEPFDCVITNAGYFYEKRERLETVNFEEDMKMIEICALAPLRVIKSLVKANLLKPRSKVALITSQAGSIAWREHQNPEGDNYGHHMSRAATNMMGRLLSFELKPQKIAVCLLHPGFNRTDMTEKYSDIWDKEGAVDPSIGAKRVIYEIIKLKMNATGRFINCEDGLDIPW